MGFNILDENEKPEELNTYIDILLSRTYRLIACLLFMADRSCTKLNGYLEEMGYRPNDPPIFGIPFRQLAFAAISTGLGICVGAVLAILISITLKSYKLFPSINITTTQIIYWTVYGVPFQMAPTFFVLLIKRYLSPFENGWPLVTPQSKHYKRLIERPWHIYLGVSIGGYFSAFAMLAFLNAALSLLIKQESSQVLNPINIFAMWSFLGMVSAAFVAFRIDSRPDVPSKPSLKALLTVGGCILQALATMVIIYFAFMHVNNNGNLNPASLTNKTYQSRLFIYLIMGLCIGASLFLASRFNTDDLERRRCKRRPSKKSANLIVGDQRLDAELQNYSKDGAFVKMANVPKEHCDPIQFKIGNDQPIAATIVETSGDNVHLRFLGDENRKAA